jgi:integrase
MTTFLAFAEETMGRREQDGIRGIDREWSRFRCHIATAPFAEKELGDIRPKDVREWLRELGQKKCANGDREKTLSRQTVHRAQTLASAIFVAAVEREIVDGNPCAGVRLRKAVDESDTEEKWAYLHLDEQREIAACEAIPLHDRLAIRFSFLTGLRQGEFRHLEIADVHLEGDSPHVVVRYAGRKNGKKLPPKSGKVRKVPLIAEAQAVTREWLELLPTFSPSNPHGLMWPTCRGHYRQQGKPLGKSGTVRKHYATAGIKLRPHLHWHALRHTCASSLLAGWWGRRWAIEEVQVVMGHSSVTITQRYAHLSEDTIAQAARETSVKVPPEAMPIVSAPLASTSLVRSMVTKVFSALRGVS